ncbi:MAG: hypothetical protein MHMPM18_002473 [Marteilia pararefringens]
MLQLFSEKCSLLSIAIKRYAKLTDTELHLGIYMLMQFPVVLSLRFLPPRWRKLINSFVGLISIITFVPNVTLLLHIMALVCFNWFLLHQLEGEENSGGTKGRHHRTYRRNILICVIAGSIVHYNLVFLWIKHFEMQFIVSIKYLLVSMMLTQRIVHISTNIAGTAFDGISNQSYPTKFSNYLHYITGNLSFFSGPLLDYGNFEMIMTKDQQDFYIGEQQCSKIKFYFRNLIIALALQWIFAILLTDFNHYLDHFGKLTHISYSLLFVFRVLMAQSFSLICMLSLGYKQEWYTKRNDKFKFNFYSIAGVINPGDFQQIMKFWNRSNVVWLNHSLRSVVYEKTYTKFIILTVSFCWHGITLNNVYSLCLIFQIFYISYILPPTIPKIPALKKIDDYRKKNEVLFQTIELSKFLIFTLVISSCITFSGLSQDHEMIIRRELKEMISFFFPVIVVIHLMNYIVK